MRNIYAEVHATTPIEHGTEVLLMVGRCTLYEGGPHVLLSVGPSRSRVIELALTPERARELSERLKAVSERL